jgi:hypothetical protein
VEVTKVTMNVIVGIQLVENSGIKTEKFGLKWYPTRQMPTPQNVNIYSKKVKRFVCTTLRARSASRSSMTQEMLISLAPVILLVTTTPKIKTVNIITYPARSSRY